MINATIEVRMTSSRLPGKPLMIAGGKTLLEILYTRLSRSKYLQKIIVATTTNVQDDPIVELCTKLNYPYFRGSEENVLERVAHAAKQFETDTLVQITGDCPLIDIDLLDDCIELFESCYPNSRVVTNTGPQISMPWGFDVQVYKASELFSILNSEDLSQFDKEHVSHRFYDKNYKEFYNPIQIKYPFPLNRSELRVTLDYFEDYLLIKSIIEDVGLSNSLNLKMYDIIRWLDNHSEIRDSSIKRHIKG